MHQPSCSSCLLRLGELSIPRCSWHSRRVKGRRKVSWPMNVRVSDLSIGHEGWAQAGFHSCIVQYSRGVVEWCDSDHLPRIPEYLCILAHLNPATYII